MPRGIRKIGWLLAAAALLAAPPATATSLEELARQLVAAGGSKAEKAARELRAAGPAGATAALAAFDRCAAASCQQPVALERLDRLCGVRDCRDIRLYWYTDLDQALAAAQREDKPILSLALLGRLDEELSCANSRFFRTALYPDATISELLRREFVLHWRSVRQVPKLTIDFGDGKTLEQTITGNSVHFLLDRAGRLIDVLPGMYGPQTFERELKAALTNHAQVKSLSDENFARWAAARHNRTLVRLAAETAPAPSRRPEARPGVLAGRSTDSRSLSGSKSISIAPVAAATGIDLSLRRQAERVRQIDALAERRRGGVHLDLSSRKFLRQKHGLGSGEDATKLIAAFEADIALDEAINESTYRPQILRRLVQDFAGVGTTLGLAALTDWIYTQVFEDPVKDPWMGLMRRDIYAALPPPADRP